MKNVKQKKKYRPRGKIDRHEYAHEITFSVLWYAGMCKYRLLARNPKTNPKPETSSALWEAAQGNSQQQVNCRLFILPGMTDVSPLEYLTSLRRPTAAETSSLFRTFLFLCYCISFYCI
jgi:hypothetical protein